jgi:hypothetical protein
VGRAKVCFSPFQVDIVGKEGLEIVGTLRFVVYSHIVSSFSFGPKFNYAFRSLQACITLLGPYGSHWLSSIMQLGFHLLHPFHGPSAFSYVFMSKKQFFALGQMGV